MQLVDSILYFSTTNPVVHGGVSWAWSAVVHCIKRYGHTKNTMTTLKTLYQLAETALAMLDMLLQRLVFYLKTMISIMLIDLFVIRSHIHAIKHFANVFLDKLCLIFLKFQQWNSSNPSLGIFSFTPRMCLLLSMDAIWVLTLYGGDVTKLFIN